MQDSEDQPFSANLLATVQLVGARDRLSERELFEIFKNVSKNGIVGTTANGY